MTEEERKKIMILADGIEGEINRMCVTDSLIELNNMYEYALQNIKVLKNMILNTKFKED